MKNGSKAITLFACAVLSTATLSAQSRVLPAATASAKPSADSPATRKSHAVEKLKYLAEQVPAAEDDQRAYTRAYLLHEIGEALSKADPKAAQAIFAKGLDACASIDLNNHDVTDLRLRLLRGLFHANPEAAVQYAETQSDDRLFLRSTVARMMVVKDPQRAAEMLIVMPPAKNFPYDVATQVIPKLQTDDPQRLAVFQHAVDAFLQNASDLTPGPESFDALLMQEAAHLPRNQVLSLIDTALRAAREQKFQFATIAGTKDGPVAFNSAYEYETAEFLPLLRRLDPARAQALVAENAQLERQASSVPQVAEGNAAASSKSKTSTRILSTYSGGQSVASSVAQSQLAERLKEEAEARNQALLTKDPRQALAAAMTASDDIKPALLEAIITETLTKDSSVAAEASSDLISLAQRLLVKVNSAQPDTRPYDALRLALKLPEQWSNIKEPKKADAYCHSLTGVVRELAKRDSDPDNPHPNTAPKMEWPSAVAQRVLVRRCGQGDPRLEARLSSGIDDPDIRLLLEIQQAAVGGGLSADSSDTSYAIRSSDGNATAMSSF